MVTIKKISEMVGVSTTTVSNVIHGKTKKVSRKNIEKIEQMLKQTGYVRRMGLSALTNGNSKIIAVVVHNSKHYEDTILSDPFYGHLVGVLEQAIRESGYYMMFYATQNIDDIYHMALAWNIDGIIAITFRYREYEKLKALTRKPIVAIDLYDYKENDQFLNIGLDDLQGGYLMTRYLIQAGFQKLLLLAHKNAGVDRLRWEGFLRCMEEYHLPTKEDDFVKISENEEKRIRQLGNLADYVKRTPKLALFFLSDQLAVEAMMVLRERGVLIPQDVSVVGYDDNVYAKMVTPRLATVQQDVRSKGEAAVELLMRMFAGETLETYNVLQPVKLMIRNSVKV